jgi:hypothetical protein
MLTGQYFQIGFILYFLIVTPFTVAWVFAVEDLLAFFGFDDETVSTYCWMQALLWKFLTISLGSLTLC